MLPLAVSLPAVQTQLWLMLAATLAAGAALWGLRKRVWRTTLVAPWAWALASLLAVSGANCMILARPEVDSAGEPSPLLFAAAVATFCPMMAVLGAKRPQNQAWQFIVFSLWAILALPAAEAFFLRRGQPLAVNDLRAWFLWVPLVLELGNFLPTQFRWAVLLAVAGQMALLADYLPLALFLRGMKTEFAGGLLLCAASVAAWMTWKTSSRGPRGWNSMWNELCHAYGLLWPLHIAERFNAEAEARHWPVRLQGQGLVNLEGERLEAPPLVAGQHLQSLLRRFVSASWIESRVGELEKNESPPLPKTRANG